MEITTTRPDDGRISALEQQYVIHEESRNKREKI